MSDYGDDYSDYGEEWFYVEDEYMAADDLAEHAVASPPPLTNVDEDLLPEWDRFDYFNDLEYASDGYDDVTFKAQDVKSAKKGQKRKRKPTIKTPRSTERTATDESPCHPDTIKLQCSPIVWCSQSEREMEPKFLDGNEQPYALLKNWREELADTPQWARGSPPPSPTTGPRQPGKDKTAHVLNHESPPSDVDLDESENVEEGSGEDEQEGISQDALMAALQRQLAAAGGPLSGMDPQQLLQFAMRMAAGNDDGDDIAGEMADAMLEAGGEEDDADAEGNLLSWVAQQRNANKDTTVDTPASPLVDNERKSNRPPTPPSSETNRSIQAAETTSKSIQAPTKKSAPKRKADVNPEDVGESSKVVKKRITRSFNAPTAASQARAAPAKVTRATRGKKP